MDGLVQEWAGKERHFRLLTGSVMDLEAATDDRIGSIFIRVTTGHFSVKDVFHTIRLALIGGGETVTKAKILMQDHFDTRPYLENAQLAGAILCALMTGVEDSDDEEDGDAEPYKFSEISQICTVFSMSPLDLRQMRYADFVNMVRGFNAASNKKAPHLTEEEFEDILKRYEPEENG
jgi:hypothetical protein